MSQDRFHAEVMAQLEMRERETVWVCTYCGSSVGPREPCTFICCGEIGHVEEVYDDTGEPVARDSNR